MAKSKTKWGLLIFCIILVLAIGFLGSIFTSSAVNSSWYSGNKPSFTPPNWVFGPVWTILYILIGISLYLAWNFSNKKQRKAVAWLFGINLFANFLWSLLFFGMRNSLLAFVDIIIIWVTIVAMIRFTYKINKKAAWLLVPYLLWVSFAALLNLAFVI